MISVRLMIFPNENVQDMMRLRSTRSVITPTIGVLYQLVKKAWSNLSQNGVFTRHLYHRTYALSKASVNAQGGYTAYYYGVRVALIKLVFFNILTLWSAYVIMYYNPAILPVNLIISKRHIQIVYFGAK